jgi:hypothetical protein
MGFSWRGKSGARPDADSSDEATATGASYDVNGETINPVADLKKFQRLHKWDPYLDNEKLDTVDQVLDSGDMEKEAAVETTLLVDDSPYAEVRAAVSFGRPLTSFPGLGVLGY